MKRADSSAPAYTPHFPEFYETALRLYDDVTRKRTRAWVRRWLHDELMGFMDAIRVLKHSGALTIEVSVKLGEDLKAAKKAVDSRRTSCKRLTATQHDAAWEAWKLIDDLVPAH